MVWTAPDRSWTHMQLATEHETRNISVQAGYAMWAPAYDQVRNPLIAVEGPHVDALVSSMPLTSAVDVGTGTGRHALSLARRGIKVTAIDQSQEMLAVAREAAQREGLTIDFRRADIEERLPFERESTDLVICTLTLCHVSSLSKAAEEFGRILRPGGFVLITDVHPDVVDIGWTPKLVRPGVTHVITCPGHTRDDYLDSLAAAGFTLDRVIDAPLRDVPDGYVYDGLREEFGEYRYCLIALARKPDS